MQVKTEHGHRRAKELTISGDNVAAIRRISTALIFILVMAVGMWTFPVYAAKQQIKQVDITNGPDAVQITVNASRPITLRAERLGARYIAFNVQGNLASKHQKRVSINSGGIGSVKCVWFKNTPPTARIVVATSGTRQYVVKYEDGKRRAIIKVFKQVPAPAAAARASKSPNTVQKQVKLDIRVPSPASGPISTISDPEVSAEPVLARTFISPVNRPFPQVFTSEPEAVVASKPILVASIVPILPSMVEATAIQAESRVSLDFVATDIHDVLKALSMQSGVNVVASPDVKGAVTVSLNNVSVEDALKLVTNLSGYKFAKTDGAYVVGTQDNLKGLISGGTSSGDERVTEVMILKYASPELLMKTLESQFGIEASVNDLPAGDSKEKAVRVETILVMTGARSSIEAGKSFVAQVESSLANKAAACVTELYEVKYTDISQLPAALMASVKGLRVAIAPGQGFDQQAPSPVAMGGADGGYSSSGQGATAANAPSRILILEGYREEVDRAKDILAKLDIQQAQIIIEAKVLDISGDGQKDLGIDWGNDQGYATTLSENRTADTQALTIGRLSRSAFSIGATIDALIKSKKAKVLANPNVLALDGKPASIFIGDEVKYVIRIDKNDFGTTVTTETARVGVQLHSISRVSSDGFITMDLHPEVSVITEWVELPEVDLALPEISRRYVDSTIRVKDGETIVIGGLIKDEEIKSMSGVPILKDLPLLGGLFRTTSKSKNHSEVMIFITPRILSTT